MPFEPFTVTREEIYAAVWSKPMRDACKKFGVTDVALAKVCRRLNVPRPRQGYWLKVAIGQSPPKEELPAAGADTPSKWERQRWVEPPADPAAPAKKPGEPTLDEPISVADMLDDLHPALLSSMKMLKGANKKRGDVHFQQPCVAITVSPALLDRSLLIMDALFRALESRGLRVEITAPSKRTVHFGGGDVTPSRTGVHVDESFIRFELVEGHDVVEVSQAAPERAKRRSIFDRPPSPPPPRLEERPNGKLVLKILDASRGFRKTWSDGRYRRVEDCLHRVVETIMRKGEELRRQRLERERWHREWEERERQRKEQERLQREEEQRVADSRAMLADWREARDLRGFIDEARAIVAAASLVL